MHCFACLTDSRTPQEPVHDVCRLEGPANEGQERETVCACTVSCVRLTHRHPRSPYTTCAGLKGRRMRAGKGKRCVHTLFRVSDRLMDTPGTHTRHVQA